MFRFSPIYESQGGSLTHHPKGHLVHYYFQGHDGEYGELPMDSVHTKIPKVMIRCPCSASLRVKKINGPHKRASHVTIAIRQIYEICCSAFRLPAFRREIETHRVITSLKTSLIDHEEQQELLCGPLCPLWLSQNGAHISLREAGKRCAPYERFWFFNHTFEPRGQLW